MVDIVVKVGQALGVNLEKKDVSTAHRLPAERNSIAADKKDEPAAIIARFVSRDVRILAFKQRFNARKLTEFSMTGMKKLFVNENLTKMRKRLLRKTKQAAKEVGYHYVWTWTGRIYAHENKNMDAIIVNT